VISKKVAYALALQAIFPDHDDRDKAIRETRLNRSTTK